jgi:hypothetical protein
VRQLGFLAGTLIALTPLSLPPPEAAGAESRVMLIPASGSAGTPASLLGRDFGRRAPVIVRVGRRVLARTRTSRGGSFTASFIVPQRRRSPLRVISRSGARRVVNLFRFSVSSAAVPSSGEVASRRGKRIRWTPSEAPVGSAVRLRGSGFPARRAFRIRFGRLEVGTGRTRRRGRFSTGFVVPSLPARRHPVRVKLRSTALGFLFRITPSATAEGTPGAATPGVTPDPLVAAAGDIACDPSFTFYNNGLGTASRCRQKYTSDLVVNAGLSAVLPLGDIQYECGGYSAFTRAYDPTWGRVKAITHPALGNHEYHTAGGSDCDTSGDAGGYFRYFGASAGDPSTGYYSYDLGAWHLIALNSNCLNIGCSSTSAQEQWLRQDLAAHRTTCTLAYWHHPRFTSGSNYPGSPLVKPLYQALYDNDADLVLVGHDHHYERFVPQDPDGAQDPVRGIRQFVVGTGGRNFHPINTVLPNSEVRNNVTFGVLKLTLHPASYDWQFVPEAGKTFTDSGSQACH